MAPLPDAPDYYPECHWESMIYSRAYQVGIYTQDRVISSYKPKVDSRVIRKVKRILRKKSEPRTEANYTSSLYRGTNKNEFNRISRTSLIERGRCL